MNKRLAGCTAAALTACLALGSLSTAYAATEVTLAGFGANVKKESTVAETEKKAQPKETEVKKAETQPKETEVKKAETEKPVETEKKVETEAATEAVTEAPLDRSMVDTTGFAKAEDYINVRAAGYAEADVVGVLTNNDSVYIEDVDEDGWYKIRSGNVEGYVAGYLIATGDEAQAIASETAYTYAQVGAESLNVRAAASEDSEVVDMVGPTSDLEVVEDLGDWVKVVTENGVYGYVSAGYVNTQTVYPTGETVQEQSEREEAEYLAAVAQQEAEAQAQAAAYAQAQQEMVASMPSDVQALYEAYLAAQEAAMHPVDEADAAAKAEAAVAAYNAYLAACGGSGAQTTTTTDAGTTSGASSSEIEALYQAYLAAQEAAMHPVDEADAVAKANAAIEAYNAYLAACGSSQSAAPVTAAASTSASTSDDEEDEDYEDDEYVDAYDEEDEVYDDEEVYEDEEEEEEEYLDADGEDDSAAASSSGSGLGAQIAAYATQFVGNPYVYGGASLTGGADCSGFTMAVYANFGIGLPHNAAAQSGCGTQVSLSNLQPGDLLFYDNGGGIGHVTMYIGGGQVVHASSPETGIKISPYNYRSPVCAVRLV